MKLYNTLTKQLDEVMPDGAVKLYTCGPTVYLDPHIGNWRMFLMYDLLVRTLRENSHDVDHVLNLTDVGHLVSDADDGEDKLQKSAAKQNKTAWEVAEHYIGVFKKGMADLNMLQPSHLPRATEFMQQQIDMVKTLEEKGFTYKIDDGIYFDTSKFAKYYDLQGGKPENTTAHARIETNDQKRNEQDFALWKFSPRDQKRDMEWDSPWGIGFPGWHLECSAMAKSLLGDTIDIHAGGIDHIPVHHTNEIAQSEAATGQLFSKIWIHGEFMNVDGKKMSKSLGNVYTLEDIKAKGFTPLDFRMLVLQAHYRTHQNFTWDALQAAHNRLNQLYAFAELRHQTSQNSSDLDFTGFKNRLIESVSNNLNTPEALAVIAEAESALGEGLVPQITVDSFVSFLETIDRLTGLELINSTPDLNQAEKDLIAKRQAARANKDYTASDDLRDKLNKLNIEVDDTAAGTIWHRTRS